MPILIKAFPSGPFRTNCYLLSSSSSNEAVIVDPAPNSASEALEYVQEQGNILKAIWITHSHWDHIADCSTVLASYPIPVLVHKHDAENLIHPGSDGIPLSTPIQSISSPTTLNDNDILSFGNTSWQVLHTPGHSLGSVCFYNAEEGILLTGDTLFKGTMGNVSFPTSSPFLMGQSLLTLSALPPSTKVFPGHGRSTTIGDEHNWMTRKAQELLAD
jgi:glyoxylase-like metal-dependent hydrolase (beta-lactamase superfamily II)